MAGQPPLPSDYPPRHDDDFVRRPLPPYNRAAGQSAEYTTGSGGGYRGGPGGGGGMGGGGGGGGGGAGMMPGRGDFHNNRRYDDRGDSAPPLPPSALSSPSSASFPRSRQPYPPAGGAPYGGYPPPPPLAYHNSAYPPPPSAPQYGNEWSEKERDRRDRRFDDGRDMYEYERERGGRDREREAGELSSYPPYPQPPLAHSPLSQPVGAPNGRGSSRPSAWSSPWTQQQQPPYPPSASNPPPSSAHSGPPLPPLSSPTASGYTIREMSDPQGRDRYWDRRGPPQPSNYAQPPPPPVHPGIAPVSAMSPHAPLSSYQPQREYRDAPYPGRHHPYRRPSGGAVSAGYPPAPGYPPGRPGMMGGMRYGRSSRSSSRSRSPSPSGSRSATHSRSRSRSPLPAHNESRSRSRSAERLRSDSREPPLPRREMSVPLPPMNAYMPPARAAPRSSSPPPGPPRPYVQTGGQPHPPPPPRQAQYGQPQTPASTASFAGQPRMPSPSSHGSFQAGFNQPPSASMYQPPPSPTYRASRARSSSPPPLPSPTLSPNRAYLSRHSSMQTMRDEEEGEINEEDAKLTPRQYASHMPPQRSQPPHFASSAPQPSSSSSQPPAAFSSPAPHSAAAMSLPPPAATLPPVLSSRSVSQSSSVSVASGVGDEQKAAGELPQRQDSNIPLLVTSVPSMFAPPTSNASSPQVRTGQLPPEPLPSRDDKREERKEAVSSEHEQRKGGIQASPSAESKLDSRPGLFRSSTLHSTFLSPSTASSQFSVTLPSSLSSSLGASSASSSASTAAAAAAAAASKRRKVGFGLGLATLEKQKVPSKEELKEEADMADGVAVKREAEDDSGDSKPSLFRAVSAPEPEQRQLSPSTPLAALSESPSTSHRPLSVASPPPTGSGQPASTSASTSPAEPAHTSPAPDRKLNQAFPSSMTSPFSSPFPSAPPRPATVGTPPSLTSSLSPSPPTSPPLSPTPLSDMDEAAASSSMEEDRDKAEAAAATASVPTHLLLMSKHSLLAAIQKLDEQINAGEEERDTLMDRARDWKKRTEEIRVKGERMGLGEVGLKEEDEEDEDYEELMAEERRQREAEQRQRDKEEEVKRKEEQYAFEHFTVSDPSEPNMAPSTRIYAANHQRADHAHHHFDRLYSDFFASSASVPPPLERPSSLNVLSTISDRETRAALHLPLYSQPGECALYQDNLRMFPLYRQRVSAVVARTRRRTYGKLRRLAAQYVQAEKRWLQEEEQRNARLRNQPPLPRLSRNNAHMLQADVSGYTYDSLRDSQLTSRQYEQKRAKWSKGLVAIPPMLVDDGDRRHSRFLSRNGYIEDAKEEERQYKLSNPWTDREKAVFESKYIKFPKQFRKIATYLPNKNVNDCVAYYYYSKLSVNYAELVRREQKRQRIEKRGRRKGEGGEEEEEEDEDGQQQQQQQQQQQELDAAAGGPGGSGSGRMAAAGGVGAKKKVATKPRVGAAKPRGISRELIGLAIDLSNQGKADRAVAASGTQGQKERGEEQAQADAMDTEAAARAQDGDEADTDEAMEEDGEEESGGRDDKLTDSTTLPTHLDLYDDEDERDAQMAAEAKADVDARPAAFHTSSDDEEELIHPALTTETASPVPAKKRRLSRSQQPSASPAGPQPAGPQQSVLWSESERLLFLSGLDLYGKNFVDIAAHVGSKSAEKCKNFFNNNKSKLALEERLARWKQQTAEQPKEHAVKQTPPSSAALPSSDATAELDDLPVLPEADEGAAPTVDRRSSVSSTVSSDGQSSQDDTDSDDDDKGERVPVRRSSLSEGKSDKERPTVLHWTQAEKDALLAALSEHGRDWNALSAAVPSRTLKQIKTWWQNNLTRLQLKELVEEVKRRKARESVAAAVSAASQAQKISGASPPAALSLPASTPSSLAVSPSMRSTAATSANTALMPSASSTYQPVPSLSSSAMLALQPSLSSLPLSTSPAGLPTAGLVAQLGSSGAAFPFVPLPGQSSLLVPSAMSPIGSNASLALSPSAPLMLMIPPTALSPATSPGRSVAGAAPFVPHLPPGALLLAASTANSPSALLSASASPSTTALLSVTAGAVEAGAAPVVLPESSAVSAETEEQLAEEDARVADVDNASVMASPPTVIEEAHVSRSLPPSVAHTPVNASTLVSPSSVFHGAGSGMDVDGGYLLAASRSPTGALSAPPLPLPMSVIPHVPFTSIAQHLTDTLAASTTSTPIGSALPSPVHLVPLSFMPQMVSRALPEAMSLASPNLSAIDRSLMSPSPTPSVSSMKGAPPSPPTAATDEDMELERPLSPPVSPTSTRRAMSTFSPLSHLAHHPMGSSPPSPASDKSSPVSSSPPSPTPSILSLHTLASPTIEGRGPPPASSSAVSSPQQRSQPAPHTNRSILRGFHLKEPTAAVSALAIGETERDDKSEGEVKRVSAADGAASSSPASSKQAVMDEEAKEESELETEEMRDDASMCTALSALPEPPSSPRQQATSGNTPRSPQQSARAVGPSLGMEEDERSSNEDEEEPLARRAISSSRQSVNSAQASTAAASSLLSPPLPSLSSLSSVSMPPDAGSLAPLSLSRGTSVDAVRVVSSSAASASGDEVATVSTLYSPSSSPSGAGGQESRSASEDAADGSSSLGMRSQP